MAQSSVPSCALVHSESRAPNEPTGPYGQFGVAPGAADSAQSLPWKWSTAKPAVSYNAHLHALSASRETSDALRTRLQEWSAARPSAPPEPAHLDGVAVVPVVHADGSPVEVSEFQTADDVCEMLLGDIATDPWYDRSTSPAPATGSLGLHRQPCPLLRPLMASTGDAAEPLDACFAELLASAVRAPELSFCVAASLSLGDAEGLDAEPKAALAAAFPADTAVGATELSIGELMLIADRTLWHGVYSIAGNGQFDPGERDAWDWYGAPERLGQQELVQLPEGPALGRRLGLRGGPPAPDDLGSYRAVVPQPVDCADLRRDRGAVPPWAGAASPAEFLAKNSGTLVHEASSWVAYPFCVVPDAGELARRTSDKTWDRGAPGKVSALGEAAAADSQGECVALLSDWSGLAALPVDAERPDGQYSSACEIPYPSGGTAAQWRTYLTLRVLTEAALRSSGRTGASELTCVFTSTEGTVYACTEAYFRTLRGIAVCVAPPPHGIRPACFVRSDSPLLRCSASWLQAPLAAMQGVLGPSTDLAIDGYTSALTDQVPAHWRCEVLRDGKPQALGVANGVLSVAGAPLTLRLAGAAPSFALGDLTRPAGGGSLLPLHTALLDMEWRDSGGRTRFTLRCASRPAPGPLSGMALRGDFTRAHRSIVAILSVAGYMGLRPPSGAAVGSSGDLLLVTQHLSNGDADPNPTAAPTCTYGDEGASELVSFAAVGSHRRMTQLALFAQRRGVVFGFASTERLPVLTDTAGRLELGPPVIVSVGVGPLAAAPYSTEPGSGPRDWALPAAVITGVGIGATMEWLQ